MFFKSVVVEVVWRDVDKYVGDSTCNLKYYTVPDILIGSSLSKKRNSFFRQIFNFKKTN